MNKSNNSFLIYLFQRFFILFYDNEFCVLSSCQAFDEYIQIVMISEKMSKLRYAESNRIKKNWLNSSFWVEFGNF